VRVLYLSTMGIALAFTGLVGRKGRLDKPLLIEIRTL
jgi:hypothetical protein